MTKRLVGPWIPDCGVDNCFRELVDHDAPYIQFPLLVFPFSDVFVVL